MIISPSLQPLYDLPDLDEPPPRVDESGSSIGLIPVFLDAYAESIEIYAYTKAAIYSRWSCLTSSDAVKQNIPIKLYIEQGLRNSVSTMLESNFIDPEKDVLWFVAPPREATTGGVWGNLGKQMLAYWDSRFSDYDWVIVWDSDTFWIGNSNFFERLLAYPNQQVGYIHKSISNLWRDKLAKCIRQGGMSVDELLEYSNIPTELQECEALEKTVGHLWVYPAKHFHENHPDFVKWMWDYAGYYGNDEILSFFWSRLFDLDIFSITDTFGIESQKYREYILNPKDSCFIMHGRPQLKNIQAFKDIFGIK